MKLKQQLTRAEKLFLDKDYLNALKIYSIVLSYNSNNKEAFIGALLSDLGLDFREEAQVLYYYYQSVKDSNEDIQKSIEQLANSLYKSDLAMNDGIDYEDFLTIIEDKSNFKEAFEDAIFSTKVIISKKWQFIDFIKKYILFYHSTKSKIYW